jgi:hypothetical protein
MMSTRTATWLAWFLWTLSVILGAFDLVGSVMSATPPPTIDAAIPQSLFIAISIVINVLSALMTLAFTTVGALVVARRPGNRIGWLLCGVALSDNMRGAGWSYAWYALAAHPGALPAGKLVLWIATVAFAFTAGLIVFVFLLFPDGRLPSRRWRPLAWLTAGVMAATFLVAALAPWPPEEFGPLGNPRNPIGIASPLGDLLVQLLPKLFQLQFALLILAALALIFRFRRARGPERQQLKWVTSAIALVSLVSFTFWLPGGWRWALTVSWGYLVALLYVLAFATVPISIGIAVLRYRLYDIDIIIRRTLIYGVLTSLLALVYFSNVLLLQSLFRGFTGQQPNQFVTVLSTLTIAVLFTPLRRRVQDIIDHRFYRRKYNAEQVLAAFGAAMRNETDLTQLTIELLAVVQETMQPTHVSLWLRQPSRLGQAETKWKEIKQVS